MICPDCGKDVEAEDGRFRFHKWPGKHPATVCDMSHELVPIMPCPSSRAVSNNNSVRAISTGLPTLGKGRR